MRDGILRHSSGAGEPATLEGKIVRLVDRIAYINHDIDDALRAGVIGAGRPAGARRSRCSGRPGSERIDTLVHDLVEHSEAARRTSCRASEVGGAMLRLRTFMFQHVYLGEAARQEHARIERVLRGLFDWFCEHPEELPPPVVGGRDAGGPGDRLHRRHDRPVRDPGVDGARGAAGVRRVGPLAWRGTPTTPGSGSATRSTSSTWSARATELRRAGVRRYQGLCPFHEERSPSFGIDPVEKLYHCFGCGAGGDVFKFVMETERVGFGEALELLADRYNVAARAHGGGPAGRASGAPGATGCMRCWSARPRTTCGCCGRPTRRRGAREYLAARGLDGGDAARVPGRLLAVGLGPRGGRLAAGRVHATTSCWRRGWPSARGRATGSWTASAGG